MVPRGVIDAGDRFMTRRPRGEAKEELAAPRSTGRQEQGQGETRGAGGVLIQLS